MHRHVFVPLVLAAGAAAGAHATAADLRTTDAAFAHPQRLVDVGGRRLNLYCSGAGPVTVVFEAEGTNAAWTWHAVQPRVAARTRACVYDRAGMGFSDPSPLPPTSANAVADLHALLAQAGVNPPYVLVGNSYGGANVQLYAYTYPAQVKGLVLVEPMPEDDAPIKAASQGKLAQMDTMVANYMAFCAQAARKGFVSGSEAYTQCTGGMDDALARPLAAARLAVVTQPAYWDTAVAEHARYPDSAAQLKAARRSFGDLPLVVLTRGVSPYAIPGQPQSAINKAVEAANLAVNRELAALSTRSSHHVVAGAGHVIQRDQPDAVVDAVFEVLDRAGDR